MSLCIQKYVYTKKELLIFKAQSFLQTHLTLDTFSHSKSHDRPVERLITKLQSLIIGTWEKSMYRCIVNHYLHATWKKINCPRLPGIFLERRCAPESFLSVRECLSSVTRRIVIIYRIQTHSFWNHAIIGIWAICVHRSLSGILRGIIVYEYILTRLLDIIVDNAKQKQIDSSIIKNWLKIANKNHLI